MFLYGYTVNQIAETLTKLKRVTKRGNYKWTTSSILGMPYAEADSEEYDEEELPDLTNALPQQLLLDNLTI